MEHQHIFVKEADVEVDDGKEYIVVWEVCAECGHHVFWGRHARESATPALLALIDAG